MIEWDEIEQALRTQLLDVPGGDAPSFAHTLWTMGATFPHEGECPNAEGNADAYYENPCGSCEIGLTEVAHQVLTELAR
jgi:hypothetical protein